MTVQARIHFYNQDPIRGMLLEMPAVRDTLLRIQSPLQDNNIEVDYLSTGVSVIYVSVSDIKCIEILPEDDGDDLLVSFVRE